MRSARRLLGLYAAILLVAVCTMPAFADIGPKDQLDIYLKNPPEELYYLDLLYETPDADVYENLTESEIAALNPDMLSALRENGTGETAALATGTRAPMFGKLTGEPDGDCMHHSFSYFGLPATYRIIIVTESGTVHISEQYTRQAMQSSLTYDYAVAAGEAPPLWRQYLVQFSATCVATLLVEGVLLFLFGFSLKENYCPFLIVNIVTQLFLTAVIGTMLIFEGPVTVYFYYAFAEIVILIAETAAYAFFLKGKSRARRIVYAITANAVSCACSIVSMDALYELLTRLS